jgi:regulator of sirC expression with transglutaminase-like and TPR domain
MDSARLENAAFEELIQVPEEQLNLAAVALALAQDVYPGLDRGDYLQRLEHMAEAVRGSLPADAGPMQTLGRLNAYLFQEQGFRGNREDYADPRNSYLNEVLDRRLGIPITLSLVYLEVAWRLGLRCAGVGFPGHFLVRCSLRGGHAVLDPFNGGVSLGEDDLRRMARHVLGERFRGDADLLPLLGGSGRRALLGRLLRNLKLIHLDRGEHEDALRVVDRMLRLDPHSAADLLDRARLYDEMGALRAALADYQACLAEVPEMQDAGAVAARCADLRARIARLN